MAEYPGASSQRDPTPRPSSGSRNEDVVPTLRDLSLLPVPNWYLLGLQLGVSGEELDMIERNYPRDNDLCKVKMFGAWLRMDTSASYEKLARALVTLGKRNIAEALCTARGIPLEVLNDGLAPTVRPLQLSPMLPPIRLECVTRYEGKGSQKPDLSYPTQRNKSRPSSSRMGFQKPEPSSFTQRKGSQFNSSKSFQKLAPSSSTHEVECQRPSFGCGCRNCTFHSYMESGCPEPIPKTSSFPFLKVSGLTDEQQQELKSRLRVESQEIMFKFQQLFSRIYKSLCERNVTVDTLVTHLLLLGALDPVHKASQKPLLNSFTKELWNAESIEKVLYIISDYFSFFNYHVIEHIVNELGTDQDRVELQNYKKDFQQYSKRRIYECPTVYGPISSAGHADLVFKVDSAYEKFTVEELKSFEYRLSTTLHVSPQSVLRLCQVEEGCLKLTFQVPSFVQQEIFPLSSDQERALAAEGVTKLACGNYQFAAKGDDDPQDTKSVAELRTPGLQTALTLHDSDADPDPCFKELDELDEEFEGTLLVSSGRQLTESTPELHRAASRGDLEIVRLLMETEHQNPLLKDKYGDTALHAAAQGGSLDVLKYFIEERNCNPAYLGCLGRTPLHVAAEHAHLDVVKYLVTEQQVEPLCQDEYEVTPLHYGCKSGCLNTVKFLTEEIEKYKPMKDLMPSLTAKSESTPLHIAALKGHIDIVRFFITDLKCSPNIPGQSGRHPLHDAAERGHLHIVKYLIDEQHCDPSCLKADKSTPLHQAVYKGHLDIVKFLTLEKHCNPTSKNSSDTTPIHWAAQYGHLEVLKFFIADLKCSPNTPGRHPLHLAAEKGHLHIMKYLNEQGCDPSCLDSSNQTPLHRAASKGHLDIVKFLTLEKYCNPNQTDILKDTPLHTAAREGHQQVVQFFIEDLKCSPNIRGQHNATPHQMAETKGHHNVALYLLKFQHSTN